MSGRLFSVSSSNIEKIGYDERSLELRVILKDGASYTYVGVPKHLFEEFRDAPSLGSYLNRKLRGIYEFRKEHI